MTLRQNMEMLCVDAFRMAQEGQTHSDIFHGLADKYHLYDATSRAPIWLSRVVADVIQDVESDCVGMSPDVYRREQV